MLLSYRDSQSNPSDPLALQAWTTLAEFTARNVQCASFDMLQFARSLELCRRLTRRAGPEALPRMIQACASAGVALVLVPEIKGCQASSASKWINTDAKRRGMRGMIVLSIRYRRDDQLYFSFFREAGAMLLSQKHEIRSTKSETNAETEPLSDFEIRASDLVSAPDRFARDFIIPPEHEAELPALVLIEDSEARYRAISTFAQQIGIAPGLVVGRLQHDRLLAHRNGNRLKRVVDFSWVLAGAQGIEQTWPDQNQVTAAVMKDCSLKAPQARERVRRGTATGKLATNGQIRQRMRFDPAQLTAWRLLMRNRDLDAGERDAM